MSSDEPAVTPGADLIEHLATPELVDLGADLAEIPLDSFLDTASELPVLRTLVQLRRVGAGLRDYVFARKLLSFFSSVGTADPQKRTDYVNKLRSDGKTEAAGEVLLEVLDKALTVEKSALIGRLISHSIENDISWTDTERMSEMVTAAYLDDLRYFSRTDPSEIGESGDEVEHLLALGFYKREKFGFGNHVMSGKQPVHTSYGEHLFAAFDTEQRARQV